MAYTSNILQIVLDGTGTEIPALNVTDAYDRYIISGAVTAIGNYAIVPTGSPQIGTTYVFEYEATLDITTNGTTFSLFGVSFNQTQLLSKLEITCYYNGSAWKVKIVGSLDQATITTSSVANDAITNDKLSTMTTSSVKIGNGIGTPTDLQLTLDEVPVGSGTTIVPLNINTDIINKSWNILGNTGTTPGTNFIGTNDNKAIVFKQNGIECGKIDGTNQVTSFGLYSLGSRTNGTENVAVGKDALFTITTGDQNTAIGDAADVDSSNAMNRIAIGYGALADSNYQFAIPDNVTTIKFKGIVYTLPTVNGAGVLTNNGSGVLTWV